MRAKERARESASERKTVCESGQSEREREGEREGRRERHTHACIDREREKDRDRKRESRREREREREGLIRNRRLRLGGFICKVRGGGGGSCFGLRH